MRKIKALMQNIANGRKSRFVYMIGDDGAILIYIENGVVQRRLFAASPDRQHTKTFIDLMNEYPYAPIYMLVDIIDQSYVKHSLPPVTQLGLNKLVQRRLDRDFAKEDIKGALNLGREKKGRKDWNFLLISISAASGLQGWLDLVLDLPNRFAGIYLLPVECESIIAQLSRKVLNPTLAPDLVEGDQKKKRISLPKLSAGKEKAAKPSADSSEGGRWLMLVSHHKVGGFRQVVLKDGKLIFTRITQGAEAATPELTAGNVEQEVLNTIEYLKRLSLNDQAALDIYLIVSQEIKNNIARERIPCNQAYVFTPYEAAELFELKQAVLSADRFGDMVLASAFAHQKKPRLKLSPTYAEKLDKLYGYTLALRSSAALACLAALFVILSNAVSLPGTFLEIQRIKDQEKAKQAQLGELQAMGGPQSASAEQMTDLIASYDFLTSESPEAVPMITRTTEIVSEQILLNSLAWSVENVLADDETKPRVASYEFEAKVKFSSARLKDIANETDKFYEQVKKAFPEYEMQSTDSAGQQNSPTFDLEEVERKAQQNGGEESVFKITLKGPKPEDPNAPPVVAP